MKYTITYDHGFPDYPIQACIKLSDYNYAVASGKTKEEARKNVIAKAKVKLMELPPSEEIEL